MKWWMVVAILFVLNVIPCRAWSNSNYGPGARYRSPESKVNIHETDDDWNKKADQDAANVQRQYDQSVQRSNYERSSDETFDDHLGMSLTVFVIVIIILPIIFVIICIVAIIIGVYCCVKHSKGPVVVAPPPPILPPPPPAVPPPAAPCGPAPVQLHANVRF